MRYGVKLANVLQSDRRPKPLFPMLHPAWASVPSKCEMILLSRSFTVDSSQIPFVPRSANCSTRVWPYYRAYGREVFEAPATNPPILPRNLAYTTWCASYQRPHTKLVCSISHIDAMLIPAETARSLALRMVKFSCHSLHSLNKSVPYAGTPEYRAISAPVCPQSESCLGKHR